jgi:ATP-binding cassette, subfamily B, bacterial
MTVTSMNGKQKQARASIGEAYRSLLSRYLGPQKGKVLLLTILLTSGIAAQLVNPQVIRFFLDRAQSGEAGQGLVTAALIFIAFALLQQGFRLAADYTSQMVSWTATNQLRTDLTLHCLKLDMGFHKRRTPGEMIQRIDGDVTQLANFFSMLVIEILSNGLLVVGILLLLLKENLWVGLGMAVYTAVTFAALGSIQNLAISRWAVARQAIAQENSFIEERISGIEDIQVNGAERHSIGRAYHLLSTIFYSFRRAVMVGNLSYNLTNLVYVVGYAIGLGLAVTMYIQGKASLGTAYLVVFYVGMLSDPLQAIRREVQDLQQATANIVRINELLAYQPIVSGKSDGAVHLGADALDVKFEHVSFQYADDQTVTSPDNPEPKKKDNVLEDISFQLASGHVLGILGRTGSGKTTLTRLLFRLYDPDLGCIELDGTDLREIQLADVRKRVGLVTQDVQLFEATIRENLTFFDKALSNEKLETVLHDLGFWEWINSLPQGLDTHLGSDGVGLSAGEAQLLAFARVFLKNPGLVVLDEASSRLDPATEARIERAIDRLFEGRTGIVIAHHLKTVNRADELLILENGHVVEYGARLALAADPASRYANLLRTGLEEVMV